jgi:hypothetical protein
LGIEVGNPRQRPALIKQASVEKIGRGATGLGHEFAETQHSRIDRKFNKLLP